MYLFISNLSVSASVWQNLLVRPLQPMRNPKRREKLTPTLAKK